MVGCACSKLHCRRVWEHAPPEKVLKFRPFEHASEAIRDYFHCTQSTFFS